MKKSDFIQKGREFMLNGRLNDAKDVLTECLKLDLYDNYTLISLAEVEYLMGNHHKAVYLINEAAKTDENLLNSDLMNKILNDIDEYKIEEKLISVSFIVKNEEQTLPKAIKSIENIADEIVVVDTGSTDYTVDIATELGAKIYYFNWVNDYAAARNISIKYATSKWILYLDADEHLSPESAASIRSLAMNAEPDTGGLICKIVNKYLNHDNSKGTHEGKYPRFFRNIGYPVLHFFGKVHEQISPSYIDRGYKMVESPLVINHDGYAISRPEMAVKMMNHIKTLTDDLKKYPEDGYTWYQLGNTLYQMSQFKESKEVLENSLKCGNLTKFLSANTALLISRCEESLGDLRMAFDWADKSLKYIPNYQHALERKVEILDKMGILDKFIKK